MCTWTPSCCRMAITPAFSIILNINMLRAV